MELGIFVLPWLTFAMLYAALYTRMIRARRARDDRRGLRAHGTRQGCLELAGATRGHVLRNAMLPGGDDARYGRVGIWITNAVKFIETVFGLPGVGRAAHDEPDQAGTSPSS